MIKHEDPTLESLSPLGGWPHLPQLAPEPRSIANGVAQLRAAGVQFVGGFHVVVGGPEEEVRKLEDGTTLRVTLFQPVSMDAVLQGDGFSDTDPPAHQRRLLAVAGRASTLCPLRHWIARNAVFLSVHWFGKTLGDTAPPLCLYAEADPRGAWRLEALGPEATAEDFAEAREDVLAGSRGRYMSDRENASSIVRRLIAAAHADGENKAEIRLFWPVGSERVEERPQATRAAAVVSLDSRKRNASKRAG